MRTAVTSFFALAAVSILAAPALADGLIVIRPHPPERPDVRNVPLAVRYHRVTVTVKGRVAVTDVDQVFVNHNPRRVEGTYLFPLPEGAAIDRFSMWVDGKETSAELLDAAKARGIYEQIVRAQRDPALLEYAERGLFKARIFPIEPHSEKRVRIRYAEVLSSDNGTVAYRYPLNTEKFSSKPLEDVSISVSIEDDAPIAALFSPSHPIDVPERLGSSVRIGWEARDVKPDKDFLLYWRPTRKDVGFSVITHRDGGDGTFLLVLAPRPAENLPPIPKDVVFVMDTSGSMAGKKMEQAQAALRYCLRSLGPEDRFGIVPFATEPRPFRDGLQPASPEMRTEAERFVGRMEARGGTAIDDALRVALGMLPDRSEGGRPAMVLFVTDGLPTIGETDADRIVDRAKKAGAGARLFVFGVGNDVNTRMLDRLAAENRGTRDYVAETESIEEKVSNLYAKLAKPAMTDLDLRIEGVDAAAVHPKALGDLFHGAELLVVGQYEKPGNAVIRLRGKVRGDVREIVEEVRLPEKAPQHSFLPRLWAVRRVAYLLEQIRLNGETAETREEVVRLAKAHGIVTPYTSYLILEDEALPAGRTSRLPTDAPMTPGFLAPAGETVSTGGGAGAGGAPAPATKAEADAGDRLRRAAADAREGEEKQSGRKSVDLSRELKDLAEFRGDVDDEALGKSGSSALVKHLSGKTFVSRGGVWWEHTVRLDVVRTKVPAFGDTYFALLQAHPWIGKYLTLDRLVLTIDGTVYEFTR
jgi:Ca-activated chloride channel family protein